MESPGARQQWRVFLSASLILAFFFLTASLVPLVGPVLVILIPLPVMFNLARLGRPWGLASLAAAAAVTGLVLGFSTAGGEAAFLLLMAFLGIIIHEVLRRSLSVERTVVVATATGLAFVGGAVTAQALLAGTTPWAVISASIAKTLQENIDLYTRMDISSEQVAVIKENSGKIVAFLQHTFPAWVTISVAFVVWINLLAARGVFAANGLPYPDFGDLTRWKAPERLVWFFIATGAALLLPWEGLKWAALNGLMVCLLIYFFQGMAIVTFFFKTRKVPPWLRYIFYLILILQQYLVAIVIAAGLFDLWVDFRRLDRVMKEPETS
ncbi:MAG TPA: YybS family protein [Syntrophales bacterium]|nr:YybS family protein [Syntrophales bacterium]